MSAAGPVRFAVVGADHLHLFQLATGLVRAGAVPVAHTPDGDLVEGYAGYPEWYLLALGWGVVLAIVLGAAVLTVVPWRQSPDAFRVWPPLRDDAARRDASTATEGGRP